MSTVETTALDLVAHPRASGGLSNVATIVGEMLAEERIDIPELSEAAAGYPTSVVQRCGWLLTFLADVLQIELDTESLDAVVGRPRADLLDPHGQRSGERDARWRVVVNAQPEPDL